jgi:hypothetical protein
MGIDPKALILITGAVTTVSSDQVGSPVRYFAIFHTSLCCNKPFPSSNVSTTDPTFMFFRTRSQVIAIGKHKKGHPMTAKAGTLGRQRYGSNTFATSALEVGRYSATPYGRFTSGKGSVPFVQVAKLGWGPIRTTQIIRCHWDSISKPATHTLS